MTREERNAYKKAWYNANKAKYAGYSKAYYDKNKQERRAYGKAYNDSLIDDFYTVYYLREEHYIGITNQPIRRMHKHKSDGRHILDYEAVATFKNKKEALNAEYYMHSIGYNGINWKLKIK